ncbi:hypothetical protein F4808DRAFT_436200 [Astrocystis sublimbata]|nr:hypothetical protein F4808DRAFT_436200 [Astrocystis sublimbata]
MQPIFFIFFPPSFLFCLSFPPFRSCVFFDISTCSCALHLRINGYLPNHDYDWTYRSERMGSMVILDAASLIAAK